ncbi:MAG: proton-conducting transporter membrane subunit [Bellilinea sp.]
MNAPIIWIVVPLGTGIILWFLRRRRGFVGGIAAGLSAFLASLAAVFPIGEVIRLGGLQFELGESLFVLGRSFNLTNNERPLLVVIFFACAVWFASGLVLKQHRFFAPFGLMVVSALIGALAVQPFLYAALLVELAVLLSIPLLVPPGEPVQSGVQRFLIFQTMGMPFILLAGWVFGSGDIAQIDPAILPRAAVVLGLGFALWLGVFPFYFWVPQLTNQTHPFSAGFVLSLLPVSILMLGLDFISQIGWLRASSGMFLVVQLTGVLMIITAGSWAAFQDDISRLFGYAVILESGYALLSIGLNTLPGYMIFAAGLLPRLLNLFVLATALSVLRNHGQPTDFDHLQGIFQRFPVAVIGLALALFSISGIPLLAGFPVRLEALELFASQRPVLIGWVLLGNLGFLIGVIRVLLHVVRVADQPEQRLEIWKERGLLLGGMLFLVLFGLMPGVFYQSVIFILRVAPALLTAR